MSGPRTAPRPVPPGLATAHPGADAAVDEATAIATLRRVRWLAAGYGAVAATGLALAGGPRRGLVLTGGVVLSIVALRSLEGVVRRLRAPSRASLDAERQAPGDREREQTAQAVTGLGWRYPLRLLLLLVLVILLAWAGRDALALVLGVSAVPAALLVEAALQLTAARRPASRESEH